MFALGWDAAKKQEPLEIQDEVWWAPAPPATKEMRDESQDILLWVFGPNQLRNLLWMLDQPCP